MKQLFTNNILTDVHGTRSGYVVVENGIITEIGEENPIDVTSFDEVIDGNGLHLMPGFIDPHIHLRDPGFTYKEDIESGLTAAAKGGYTTVYAMANTRPICDSVETISYILDKAKQVNLGHRIQVAAIGKELHDTTFVDIEALRKYTPLFSNDGYTINDENFMREALRLSSLHNFTLLTHCDPESEIIRRDLRLLEEVGGNLHICHISEQASLEAIRDAKARGLHFTCEVGPHHIYAQEMSYRVNPPIGNPADRQAMIEGLRLGIIDMHGSDHAPHSPEDKAKGAPGISLIDVAFGMYWFIYHQEGLSLSELSRRLSYNPARMLGLNSGEIVVGREADFTLVDSQLEHTIDLSTFVSRSKNNPFEGMPIRGVVMATYKAGKSIFTTHKSTI